MPSVVNSRQQACCWLHCRPILLMKALMERPMSSAKSVAESLPRPASPGFAVLDACRGVAALMVVVFHATSTYRSQVHPSAGSIADLWWQLLDNGWLGVQLFFVISGYCIAATVDAARRKPSSVGTFTMRRVMRVYPTFAIWLILMTLAIGAAEWFYPDASFWTKKSHFVPLSEMHWVDWFSNLTLTHTWLPQLLGARSISMTEVSWTLCYEVQFYFVCGLLLAVCPRAFFPAVAAVTFALAVLFLFDSATGPSHRLRGSFLDGRWLQFAMGIGVYYFLNYRSPVAQRAFAALLAAAAISCWFVRNGISVEAAVLRKNLMEMAFCASFAAVLIPLKAWDVPFRNSSWTSPLMKCGLISYSLYLVHWPFCKIVSGGVWKFGIRTLPETVCVTIPLCAAVSLGAAVAYYSLVERHFINSRPGPR
jgi:peptidoglycan/LPS O-acetylase OafA/YrhL